MTPTPEDELYDEVTLGRLAYAGAPGRDRTRTPAASGWRGRAGAGAIAAAVVFGVRDVLEPEDEEPIVEEIDVAAPAGERWVSLHFVPGAPRLTRAIIRPWLAPP